MSCNEHIYKQLIKIGKLPDESIDLFETVLISANDQLVELFMLNKIKFTDIYKYLSKIINLNEFKPYFKTKTKNVNQIIKLSSYVKLKTKLICSKQS